MKENRLKRNDSVHETFEKKEIIDICLGCTLPICKAGKCKRLFEERKKIKSAGVSTKIPEYEN